MSAPTGVLISDLFRRPVLNLRLTFAHVVGNVVAYDNNITQ